jgi:hypothetical protein
MINRTKLQEAGFTEIPKREIWYHRDLRMAFTHQALLETEPRWMETHLAEKVGAEDFVLYFGRRLPRDIHFCTEILAEIGLPKLRPNVRLATFSG